MEISGVISRVTITITITHTRGLITLLITTHEPPSDKKPCLQTRRSLELLVCAPRQSSKQLLRRFRV